MYAPAYRNSADGLFALLGKGGEHGGVLFSFRGIRVNFLKSVHDLCVFRANLLGEAVSLGSESFERLGVVLLIGFFHLFLELAYLAIGLQLGLVARDCLNKI